MRRTSLAPLAFVGLLALSGAGHAGLFDDEEARRQVNDIKKRVEDLNGQLDSRVSALEATVRSKGLLDLLTQVEQIRGDINALRGQLEVMHNDVETTQKRQRDLYVDLDTRMRKMETLQTQQASAVQALQAAATAAAAAAVVPGTVIPPPGGASASMGANGAMGSMGPAGAVPSSGPAIDPTATPGVVPVPSGPGAIVPGVTTTPQLSSPIAMARPSAAGAADAAAEQRAYDAALDQFKSGNYAASLQSFVGFVKTYPRSPLAPSAQYWVGNAHYALKDYRSAISSQRQLITSYPDSQKVPDAMLNISSSQIELGDTQGAKRTLDELVLRYPASEAADRAKKRLPGAR